MKKITTCFILFFAVSLMHAQKQELTCKFQARDGEKAKDGVAKCFVFSFTKNAKRYSFLLTTKDLVNSYKTLTFFFENDKTVELPIDAEHIIQTSNPKNPLVAIPFILIREKNDTIRPICLQEDLIASIMKTTEANVEELKKEFEKWIDKE